MQHDRRYCIQREWCGYADRRHVVRFCDAWVGSSPSLKGARALRDAHRAEREAALTHAA